MLDAVRRTTCGKICGTVEKDVHVWRGIPYAQPPIGPLRFRPAQPVSAWDGVYGNGISTRLPQRKRRVGTSEDCLYLNIWSPGRTVRSARCFSLSTAVRSRAGGQRSRIRRDVPGQKRGRSGRDGQLPAGRARFSRFLFPRGRFRRTAGFPISLPRSHGCTEYRSIRRRPENITVFGQSAGAIAASVLPVMPSARNYVSKVIMMSGGPSLLYTKESITGKPHGNFSFMNISTPEELRLIPAEKLAAKQKNLLPAAASATEPL